MVGSNGSFKGRWNFPKNLIVSDNFAYVEYQNGVMNLITREDNLTWKISSSPIEDPIFNGMEIFI